MPYGIGGALPGWNSDDTTNRLKQSYVKDFIDISGSLVLRNNANLYVEGNKHVETSSCRRRTETSNRAVNPTHVNLYPCCIVRSI